MTNKLPVVGKRYKEKHTNKIVKCVINSFSSPIILKFETDDGEEVPFNLTMWERLFEELPEDNQDTKKNLATGLSKEVLEAMEKLREVQLKATLSNQYYHEHYKETRDKANNLLNALDMHRKQENLYNSEEYVKKNKESIWKPVSELPEDNYTVVIKFKDGGSYFGNYREENQIFLDQEMKYLYSKEDIKEYCLLTDFINQHNSLLDRVERLERIIGGK